MMYSGSADEIVTTFRAVEVEQVRQHAVETIIFLLWISSDVCIYDVDRRRHAGMEMCMLRRCVLPVCTNTPRLADCGFVDAGVCDNRQMITLHCRLYDLDAIVPKVLTRRCGRVGCFLSSAGQRHAGPDDA